MGMGLVGIGRQKANQAMNGFSQASNMEQQRNQAEETLKANKQAAQSAKTGMAVSTGLMAGMMINPAVGIAVGLATMLF